MRGNDKLPRGSFFYIQVGPKFYAGKAPVKVEVNTHRTEMLPRMGGYTGRWTRYRGFQPNKPHCRPVLYGVSGGEKVTVHTGEFTTIMVDERTEAKQFRRLKQAEAVRDELARDYSDIGVQPTIQLHQGGTQ